MHMHLRKYSPRANFYAVADGPRLSFGDLATQLMAEKDRESEIIKAVCKSPLFILA